MNTKILGALIDAILLSNLEDKDSNKSKQKNLSLHLAKMSKKEVIDFLKTLDNEKRDIVISSWNLDFFDLFSYCSENGHDGLKENLIRRKDEISRNHKAIYRALRKTQDIKIWEIIQSSNVVRRTVLKRAALEMSSEHLVVIKQKKIIPPN